MIKIISLFFIYSGSIISNLAIEKIISNFKLQDSPLRLTKDYYYYLKNLQNDIIAIADENGNIVGEYFYDAFGRVELSYGTIAQINPFRFKSYYYDVETSFYYCNSRYYDPLIGRWINADTIRVLGLGETNLFTYCNNNPAMNVDPSGCFAISLTILGLIIGAVVGATAGGIVAHNVAKENDAEGWELFGWTMLGIIGGGTIGGTLGYFAAPYIGTIASSSFTVGGGGLVLAGVGTSGMTLTGAQVIGAGVLATGLTIMFAKDPLIKNLENKMSKNQRDVFSDKIHEYKRYSGRGGKDNLDKNWLKELAEWILENVRR
ncbi:MAG: RHS repeat-associated core domain-containing protein [Candidatus Cloacimonetes bacterium]|nr:RHS repeat-associated core domain-containing protein [Candidatus Cloacimonadota bacterium]